MDGFKSGISDELILMQRAEFALAINAILLVFTVYHTLILRGGDEGMCFHNPNALIP
jgi:hypothetical protein